MKTLLLNVGYEPIMLISWKKAVLLYLLGKAEIVETYQEPLRSQLLQFNKPAVMRLFKYHRSKEIVKLSRQNIFARDQYTCQYCNIVFKEDDLTLDHVHPQSRGGGTTWTNLTTACAACNGKKDSQTPKEAKMKLLRKPFRPKWMPSVLVKAIRFKTVPEQWSKWIDWIKAT